MVVKASYPLILKEEDFDKKGNILPSRIFYYFQEAASKHSEEQQIGFDDLIQRNLIWMVARNRYDVLSSLKPGTYQIITWPHPYRPFEIERDYVILNSDHQVVIKGTSLWCLFSLAKERLAPTSLVPVEGDFCLERNYEERLEKIHIPEGLNFSLSFTHPVEKSDLDRNEHMNNCRYVDLVSQALKKEEIISFMEVNYEAQCYLDEMIDVYLSRKEDEVWVVGKKEEQTCFVSYFKVK